MSAKADPSTRVWTVSEAKERLSEILHLSEQEGPQRIGTWRQFVVVPAAVWDATKAPRTPLGRWLIENMPRGIDLDPPDRASKRAVPFS
ncbi:MAG: hypothetical protein F4053_04545 [Proteobacteria bacterium]|nr:hypothetical protein [Pseudomonadota bacterium]MYJ94870.1 hypothetical protein [Pseudomonadota bacterium]